VVAALDESADDLRYLEDPKDAFGKLNEPAKISTIVKKNLSEDEPVAYTFMKALALDEEHLNDLESTINEVGEQHEGAKQWAQATATSGSPGSRPPGMHKSLEARAPTGSSLLVIRGTKSFRR
jgi:hypothetical protein